MKRPTVPLGKPLNSTEDELDLLSLITPEDIEAARADGRANMRPLGRALLEAARVEPPPADAPTNEP